MIRTVGTTKIPKKRNAARKIMSTHRWLMLLWREVPPRPAAAADADADAGHDNIDETGRIQRGSGDGNSSENIHNEGKKKNKPKKKGIAIDGDGWLVAAPKKNRKPHTKAEIEELSGYDEVRDVAVTEACSGLLVKQYEPKDTATTRADAVVTPLGDNNSGVPNFKRFRKNRVPPPPVVTTLTSNKSRKRIKLRAVVPVETQHQIELQDQQQLVEEEQRVADELFSDPVPRGGGRRR